MDPMDAAAAGKGVRTPMLFGFQKIVEQRILDAQKKGDFDNLAGAGKPLSVDEVTVPEDLRLAYKILKNAGCLPREIELKREIRQTEELLATMEDTEEKYRTLKKLNYMIMKFNMLRGASVRWETPQVYEEKLVERFGRKWPGEAEKEHGF